MTITCDGTVTVQCITVCSITAPSLHCHCTITAPSLLQVGIADARDLFNTMKRCDEDRELLCHHCAIITAPSLRHHCAIIAPSLHLTVPSLYDATRRSRRGAIAIVGAGVRGRYGLRY